MMAMTKVTFKRLSATAYDASKGKKFDFHILKEGRS
jgi:hypothetical protein